MISVSTKRASPVHADFQYFFLPLNYSVSLFDYVSYEVNDDSMQYTKNISDLIKITTIFLVAYGIVFFQFLF